MTERGQKFGTSVIKKGKLEVRHKSPGKGHKISMRGGALVNIPLRSFACKRAMELPKTDGIIGNRIG